MRHQRAEPSLKLDGLKAARIFVETCFGDADRSIECLWVAHLDCQTRFLHVSRHDGDPEGVEFPLHEIIFDAALHGSVAIVLAHNHPSGDATPSHADIRATQRLASVTEALNCVVLDHLIVADKDFRSFRMMGLL